MDSLNFLENIFLSYELNHLLVILCTSATLISEIVATSLTFLLNPILVKNLEENRKSVVKGIVITLRIVLMLLMSINIINHFTCHFSDPKVDYGEWVYFGQTAGNKPEGYGHCYDKQRNIVYIGEFKSGRYDGQGKMFGTAKVDGESHTYLLYQGGFKAGEFDGKGEYYDFVDGVEKLRYKGEYDSGKRNGYCEECNTYENGELIETYIGGWADDIKCGYGVTITYAKKDTEPSVALDDSEKSTEAHSNNILSRYRGTYWKGVRWGKGIFEFIDESEDNHGNVVYVGRFKNDWVSEEGVYYSADTKNIIIGGKIEDGKVVEKDESIAQTWPFPEDTIW